MRKAGRPRDQTARREALVSAAGRAIAERGLEALRIKDIAEAAGVSQGSVLYYYPELDDLVLEVHRGAVEGYLATRQQAYDEAPADDPAARLRALLNSGLPGMTDDPVHGLLYELHRRAGRSPGHAELMASLFAREVALYTTALAVGAATGGFTLAAPLRTWRTAWWPWRTATACTSPAATPLCAPTGPANCSWPTRGR
ncbi:TetR/AcrR family transcriptional regulator [Streptomyces diastatochromogenes]|nr:TetR/AcrR family transcriptional regulator [Streptomyces diastatochromogenes]